MIAVAVARLASTALVLALSGCQAISGVLDPGPHITTGGNQLVHAGIGLHGPTNARYVVGDLIICLDESGEATINAIESVQPEGSLWIDEFAVIPNDMERGLPGFGDGDKTICRARHRYERTGDRPQCLARLFPSARSDPRTEEHRAALAIPPR